MKIFNSYHLKIIALLTMIIDHVGIIFFPDLFFLRIIGRIAFVLYAFMLVEGFFLTSNIKKYFSKLFAWAFISEIPYDLAFHKTFFYWNDQNVFFTLFIGLAGMYFLQKESKAVIKLIITLIFVFSAMILKVDYSWYGVSLIFIFYFLRNQNNTKFLISESLSIGASFKILQLQLFAFLGFLPILMYNGKQGKKMGDIYYSFYSIHLLVFSIINLYLC